MQSGSLYRGLFTFGATGTTHNASTISSAIGNSMACGIGVQRREQDGKLICDVLDMTPNAIGREALGAFQPEHGLTHGGADKYGRCRVCRLHVKNLA
jgi:hypothetical protein